MVSKTSPFLEEVRKEARGEERAAMLVDVLEVKFPNQMAVDLRDAIMKTRESARLKQWIALAVTVASLDDFRKNAGL